MNLEKKNKNLKKNGSNEKEQERKMEQKFGKEIKVKRNNLEGS